MARGNGIIVSSEPGGKFMEGYLKLSQTAYPGMIVQRDPTEDLIGGRHTYKIYDADADGANPKGPYYVVLEDYLQGKVVGDAYTSTSTNKTRMFLYTPVPGDELNLMLLNISGTADDHTAGEILIVDDTTGKLIATTGTPEDEVAQLLETVTDPAADTLAWVVWQGK